MTMLRGFFHDMTAACADILEEYVERGGDGGLTLNTLRTTYVLPVDEPESPEMLERRVKEEQQPTDGASVGVGKIRRGGETLR